MHECPECSQVCYCDLDDSNDCREDGECFHNCPPEEEDDYGWPEDDDWPPEPCRHGREWCDPCWRCEVRGWFIRRWWGVQNAVRRALARLDPAPPDATDEPTCHGLKTWPEPFRAMWDGWKTFEIRKDDRHYSVGDCLHLREWVPGLPQRPDEERYTGRWMNVLVTYKVPGGRWGIPNELCVLAVRETKRGAASTDTEVTK